MPLQRKVVVAKTGEILLGRTKLFAYGTNQGIAYNDGGVIKAYVNRCTHMGGPVELSRDGTSFRCRWHEADFAPATGEAIEGQAPRGTRLQPIVLEEADGQIYAILEFPDDPFA